MSHNYSRFNVKYSYFLGDAKSRLVTVINFNSLNYGASKNLRLSSKREL